MAINVDTVYRTVLLVLNKENRGYITPDEFNKTATQVQLDIFEQYFDDLNQQLRVPQRSSDYADRQRAIEQKLAPFKGYGTCIYTGVSSPVFYENSDTLTSEIQLVTRGEYNSLNKSNLTAPSLFSPISMYEDYRLKVAPSTITAGLYASFIRKPRNVVWNFTVDSSNNNAYSWDATNSTNFELLQSEQTEVIVKILLYSGVVIKDYQVVQLAAQSVQGKEINQKS